MSKLEITRSNRYALEKRHVLGEAFDQPLQATKDRILSEDLKMKQLQATSRAAHHVCSVGTCAEECQSFNLAVIANEAMKEHLTVCHPGFTIVFDNIDFAIQRRNTTMGKQNRDLH